MPIDPPAVVRDPDLAARLDAAFAARGPGYVPRTHLFAANGGPRYVNRLILEASPYLVQHAHNPVDWRPWGEEALSEARVRDVPLFLSAGYATCHWCHVMEEESFDDEAVGEVLNRDFVAIKLDREERPDLDQIFITATQLQNGHAGWPNSVWLRPDGVPFHTGTYFPKPDFLRVLQAVREAWASKRGEIDQVAEKIAAAVKRQGRLMVGPAEPPGPDTHAAAVAHLAEIHNETHGGFSERQQFPQETYLLHLIDRWRRDGDAKAWEIAARTLDAIAAGGIHDHAGGGFHRYTVDVTWRTPHFEKMLYNQGLLARAFVEGWQVSGRPGWRRAAERCFTYVLRDMTDAEGAFFAAEDADSLDAEGRREEGAFYAWPMAAVRAALGGEAEMAIEALGLSEPATIDAGPVAHLRPGSEQDFDMLDPLLERLRRARDARPRPIRDEKVIAGWNGLMIRALAEGAVAFDRPDLAAAAARAAETLWTRLWEPRAGRLARLWASGAARQDGQLEDYVWLGLACLALSEAAALGVAPAGDWAAKARALAAALDRDFSDAEGRFKMAAADGPMGAIYETSDGATPAGESAALEFLAWTAAATGDAAAGIRAAELRAALSGPMREIPLLRLEALTAARRLGEGASGPVRSLADGVLTLRLARDASGWRLDIVCAPGWHLNAPAAGTAGLVGATVTGAEIAWPVPREKAVGGASETTPVFEGRLSVWLTKHAEVVNLRLQTCSETACASPVGVRFRLANPEDAT